MLEIYEAIDKLLKDNNLVKTYDGWNRQPEKLEEGKNVINRFPAVYLEFTDITVESHRSHQRKYVSFTLHLYLDNITRNKFKDILTFKNTVDKVVYNFQINDNYTPFILESERSDSDYNFLYGYTLNYQTTFQHVTSVITEAEIESLDITVLKENEEFTL